VHLWPQLYGASGKKAINKNLAALRGLYKEHLPTSHDLTTFALAGSDSAHVPIATSACTANEVVAFQQAEGTLL